MSNKAERRERYIQVAALAAAAVEVIDRLTAVSTQTTITRHPSGFCGHPDCWCYISGWGRRG